jgi:hypothetical protein
MMQSEFWRQAARACPGAVLVVSLVRTLEMAESYEERRIRMSLQDAGMVAVDRGYLYEGAGCAVRTQAVLQYWDVLSAIQCVALELHWCIETIVVVSFSGSSDGIVPPSVPRPLGMPSRRELSSVSRCSCHMSVADPFTSRSPKHSSGQQNRSAKRNSAPYRRSNASALPSILALSMHLLLFLSMRTAT